MARSRGLKKEVMIEHNAGEDTRECIIVSTALFLALLNFLFALLADKFDQSPLMEFDHSGILWISICYLGKTYTWCSSVFHTVKANGTRMYDLHTRIAAAGTIGVTMTQATRVLNIIGVKTPPKSTLVDRARDFVLPSIHSLWLLVLNRVVHFVFLGLKKVKLATDEQYSRIQRQRGCAPFCTAVIMELGNGFIIVMAHAMKKEYKGKSLANVTQVMALILLAALVLLSFLYLFNIEIISTFIGYFDI